MKNTHWPPNEIQRLAQTSGKPAEVACAEAFLAKGWKARLGSHFADGALDTIRELDVLAERESDVRSTDDVAIRVRALVSCRGFAEERSPLMYSVSSSSVPSFEPRLLSSHRANRPFPGFQTKYGPLDGIERSAADTLIGAGNLDASRPLVALDMIERTEVLPKKGKKDDVRVEFSRCKDGDRQLFGAVDSAVKAAYFWVQQDYQREAPAYFATLNVPVCVLSLPFWEVCIDGGQAGTAEIRRRGYQSNAYPYRLGVREVMALIWTADEMPVLVKALDSLFDWFRGEVLGMQIGHAAAARR